MDLPKLHVGKRFTLPRPVGSADAMLLARLGEREKAAGKPMTVVTADANDAQRLLDEMAFFAPTLRCALFPDWETLPYDTFSPHQDLISERLATLWRISQRDKAAHRRRCGDRARHHGAVPTGATQLSWRATPSSSRSSKSSMRPNSRPSSRWRATAMYPGGQPR
jgi:transcription-repair coupling factor (superfamily II helicase)